MGYQGERCRVGQHSPRSQAVDEQLPGTHAVQFRDPQAGGWSIHISAVTQAISRSSGCAGVRGAVHRVGKTASVSCRLSRSTADRLSATDRPIGPKSIACRSTATGTWIRLGGIDTTGDRLAREESHRSPLLRKVYQPRARLTTAASPVRPQQRAFSCGVAIVRNG